MGELTHSVSGEVAMFRSADKAEIKSLKVNFSPVQEGTGDPSPMNIRPITGLTGLTVYHTPKNILPKTWFSDSIKGSFGTGSSSISAATNARCTSIYVGKNRTLYFNKTASNTIMFAFTDKHLVDRTATIYDAVNCANRTGLTMNSGDHPWLVINTSNPNTMYNKLPNVNGILWFAGQPSGYEEQQEWEPINIDWTDEIGTIYGGELDLISGVLTRKWQTIVFDGVTSGLKVETKGSTTVYDEFYFPLSNGSLYGTAKSNRVTPEKAEQYGYKCSHGLYYDYRTDDAEYSIINTRGFAVSIYIGSSRVMQPRLCFALEKGIDTVEKCNVWLKSQYDIGKPVQLWYALKTAQTYQIDPTPFKAFLDYNSLWSNAGSVEVEYAFVDRLAKKRMMMQKPDYNLFKLNVPFQNPDNTKANASNKRIFTPKTYCIGNSFQNWFVPNNAGTNYSFDNNMIVFSPNRQDYGITFPIAVSGGEYYDLSFTPSENAKVAFAIYDASGGYLTGGANMTGNVRLHMPDDAAITTLIFVSNVPNVQVIFSDIQFVKV